MDNTRVIALCSDLWAYTYNGVQSREDVGFASSQPGLWSGESRVFLKGSVPKVVVFFSSPGGLQWKSTPNHLIFAPGAHI